MSDSLKEVIDRKPEEFEIYPFDVEAGWSELAPKVGIHRRRGSNPWMYVAAGVTLLLVASVWLLVQQNQAGLPQQLFEAEAYYQEMVDARLASVRGKVDTDLILADFEEMDHAFEELRNDLKDDVDNQEVVEAMIANYRLKLKILERIVTEIEEKNDEDINKDI